MLDAAVALGGVQAVTAALRDALTALIVDPGVCLPDYVHAPMAGHYASFTAAPSTATAWWP